MSKEDELARINLQLAAIQGLSTRIQRDMSLDGKTGLPEEAVARLATEDVRGGRAVINATEANAAVPAIGHTS